MASSGKMIMLLRDLLLVIALVVTIGAMAQTPGSGGGTTTGNCTNTIASLAPCLAYVTGNSTTPSPSCCSQLGTVVQAAPQCLCTLVNGGGPSFLTINQTLALSLPGACKVQTPPVTQCKAADAPGSSIASPPETSPAPAESSINDTPEPAVTPTSSDVPASSTGDGTAGSKTVPSTTAGTSDAASTTTRTSSVQFMVVGLLVVAIARL